MSFPSRAVAGNVELWEYRKLPQSLLANIALYPQTTSRLRFFFPAILANRIETKILTNELEGAMCYSFNIWLDLHLFCLTSPMVSRPGGAGTMVAMVCDCSPLRSSRARMGSGLSLVSCCRRYLASSSCSGLVIPATYHRLSLRSIEELRLTVVTTVSLAVHPPLVEREDGEELEDE